MNKYVAMALRGLNSVQRRPEPDGEGRGSSAERDGGDDRQRPERAGEGMRQAKSDRPRERQA
jgi:hypothetical protein